MRLLIVRHGQTEWNATGRSQGQTNVGLDATGQAQAEAVGKALASEGVTAIWSSDLARARATADAISYQTGTPVELRADLRERSFGDWEGEPFDRLHARMDELGREIGVTRLEVRPPNGESMVDVWDRLDDLMEDVSRATGTLVIVTHGGTGCLLIARLFHGSVASSRSFRFGNAAYSELERRQDGTYFLVRYNVQDHLEEPAGVGGVDGLR